MLPNSSIVFIIAYIHLRFASALHSALILFSLPCLENYNFNITSTHNSHQPRKAFASLPPALCLKKEKGERKYPEISFKKIEVYEGPEQL